VKIKIVKTKIQKTRSTKA